MERNGRFTFGWCISYRPFHNPPRKEVEANVVWHFGALVRGILKPHMCVLQDDLRYDELVLSNLYC